MNRISIYGLKKDEKHVLKFLQRWGILEIRETEQIPEGFQKPDTGKAQSQLTQQIQTVERALEILDVHSPEDKSLFASLEGRKELSFSQYEEQLQELEQSLQDAADIVELERRIGEQKGELVRLQSHMEALTPWEELTVPMTWKGTSRVGVLIGCFSEEREISGILEDYQNKLEQQNLKFSQYPIHMELISHQPHLTCVCIFCPRPVLASVEECLRTIGFAKPSGAGDWVAKEEKTKLEQQTEKIQRQIEDEEQQMKQFGEKREQLRLLSDELSMKLERYQALSQISQHTRVFCLEGYLASEKTPVLEQELISRYLTAVETEALDPEEEVPVLLHNNQFAQPVESVLETYGMPSKGEADPTSIMAVFYYVLFGMMLSDAAYGLIMAVGCGAALKKFKNMEQGMKKTLQMFFYCGISTAVWGVLFGGYFGDAITVFSSTFLGKDWTIPALWFVPVNEPMKMLMFSLAVGIVHLFAGLGIQAYQLCRQHRYLDALFDVGFWYLLVGGGAGYLLTIPMFAQMAELPFTIGSTGALILGGCAVTGAVGILITAGRGSKNPFVWLLKGLYSLYNVTGYLSDILSYSRLLALGLATGVIATVFNKMGSMMGGGILGLIFFLVVFVIGHTLNLAINLLGAYVHTNRLQFVEFFGKFYEGGGRKFEPFTQHTKYYKIKEDITHG
ncbi:MAG: V-type ATP synthase subunit I [Massiliimalia sp.]